MKNLFRRITYCAVTGLASLLSWQVLAVTTTVPGTSDPWLSGMPNTTTASFNPGSGEPADVAPDDSPVLVPISVVGGTAFNWSASGEVGHPGDVTDPDGKPSLINYSHFTGAEHGISDITVPIDSLIGVFLGPDQPDLNPPPSALDFSTAAARDYMTLAPALQQVFFLGDGLTDGGDVQMGNLDLRTRASILHPVQPLPRATPTTVC